ncbi:uncharacterized protein CLAFUR5_09259 [Fulvia fulva]|uniref:Uncharacterized protein n=1 Tax=Passalora fulva TaxID=5499 RepID=A0A9Q8PG23_PASFU|nr:uncharacterized protein CLAFUR5_09259 [Fulvia fulva]UJO21944.1 hypothetical protein CLAFUR5_09259 [Fulvia fulva]
MQPTRTSSEAPRAKKRKKSSDDDDDGEYIGSPSKKPKTFPRRSHRLMKKLGANFLPILPAELRNKIYEYALIEDNEISITPTYQLPPLLRTCHQIRGEATLMYWGCNTFGVFMRDYDVSLLLALLRKPWRPYFFGNRAIRLHYTLLPRWSNARMWLKAIHSGALPVPSRIPKGLEEEQDRRIVTAWGCFWVLASLIPLFRNTAWDKLVVALDAKRNLLGAVWL